jgi:hypothetical protein
VVYFIVISAGETKETREQCQDSDLTIRDSKGVPSGYKLETLLFLQICFVRYRNVSFLKLIYAGI